jgi:RNA polymerase sigma factor (TIGR02999 family)
MTDTTPSNDEISVLLKNAQAGDDGAANDVFELLLSDMLEVARGMMKSERLGHTLQATALVNEACVRLLQQDVIQSAENRRYLFGAASRAMQQILVDHARTRKAQKRGGDRRRIPMDELLDNFEAENGVSFENLHLALEELGTEYPRERELVEHRYFGGFSVEETAELMGISTATVTRDWTLARARLYAAMKRQLDQG